MTVPVSQSCCEEGLHYFRQTAQDSEHNLSGSYYCCYRWQPFTDPSPAAISVVFPYKPREDNGILVQDSVSHSSSASVSPATGITSLRGTYLQEVRGNLLKE